MQIELKRIQREVGITFVYVTHDQEEALTMSDRIAVFHAGRVEQVGTPAQLYEHPATAFVAGFIGTSNLVDGAAAEQLFGATGTWSVRPEKIRVTAPGTPAGPEEHSAPGRVADVVYAGAQSRLLVDLDAGARLTVLRQNSDAPDGGGGNGWAPGAAVLLAWRREHTVRLHERLSEQR